MAHKNLGGVRVATYITPELFTMLIKKADELHTTPSAIIRHMISTQLKGKK